MQAEELIRALVRRGADGAGINDRFYGNAALYEKCFRDFLQSPNHATLADALASQEYSRAFDAAHSLKGLSGNLGLTPYYAAICALVESLRANRTQSVAAEHKAVQRELQSLRQLGAGKSVVLRNLVEQTLKGIRTRKEKKP